ncbi:MAG: TIGR01548 family HAD-type hydrolase [Prochlorotrichaceae cyanobacterium]|jgi:HAD superfamily phosphatase
MSMRFSPSLPCKAIVIFDIDGVVRDVGQSYRRALADTVEHYTQGAYRPTQEDIDRLKAEGIWNNDWRGSQELTYRYWESQGRSRDSLALNYDELIDFFQRRYRGQNLEDPQQWDGYISQEPLLMQRSYLQALAEAGYAWGFFSGATRGSALYVLTQRLGLDNPPLVAMGDAPDKPDPTGLFLMVQGLEEEYNLPPHSLPVFYAGDTVADLYTVNQARDKMPQRQWVGVGVLPPHVQNPPVPQGGSAAKISPRQTAYAQALKTAGAETIVANIEELNPQQLAILCSRSSRAG